MIIGAFIGISAGISFVTLGLPNCGGAACSDWGPYAAAGIVLVGGYLLGLVFVAIVGSASTFMIFGAAIGLIVALVNGEWVRAPGFVLLVLASWILGYGQETRYAAQRASWRGPVRW